MDRVFPVFSQRSKSRVVKDGPTFTIDEFSEDDLNVGVHRQMVADGIRSRMLGQTMPNSIPMSRSLEIPASWDTYTWTDEAKLGVTDRHCLHVKFYTKCWCNTVSFF